MAHRASLDYHLDVTMRAYQRGERTMGDLDFAMCAWLAAVYAMPPESMSDYYPVAKRASFALQGYGNTGGDKGKLNAGRRYRARSILRAYGAAQLLLGGT
jgi:hypothetical protein